MKLFNACKKYGAKVVAGVSSGVASVVSWAQTAPATTFDASTYADQVTGTIPGLLLVGGATFAVVLAIKSTKWGKRAL